MTFACSRKTIRPFEVTNKVYTTQVKSYADTLKQLPTWVPNDSLSLPSEPVLTTNFNMRKPNFVIIHHTAQDSCAQTLRTFTLPRTKVSAHYVICKDGTVHHMLSDYLRAWHAGISKWGNVTDINSASIGIELDNNGLQPFDSAQINSLLSLLTTLKSSYGIPAANFIGHGDIAPKRKNDPSKFFPWKKLADNGFGLWYDEAPLLPEPDSTFNPILALRIIGYDVKDTSYAIQAFKRHFTQDNGKQLTDWDKRILQNLYPKYMQ